MKKNLFLAAFISLLMSSCIGLHNTGLTGNSKVYETRVELNKKNFKVIARVKGESRATYVFGIGGVSKNALVEEARADMLSKADIIGGARAIINETVETKLTSYFGVVLEKKIIVSASIIEFTE